MIKTAIEYHDSTSYDRNDMSGHYLDWQNQPMVFKDYPGVMPVVLPAEVNLPSGGLFELINQEKQEKPRESLDLKDLSSILRLSYSLTARARQGGGDFYFRSPASAGALYPCEIYVASHSVNELENGLYHFAIHRHCLYPLRKGDMASYLAGNMPVVTAKRPRLTFLLTAIYYRSAWKYRERSYRYHLLDTGHLLENLILALNSLGLDPDLSFDFNDDEVNQLLGLDEKKEACLALISVPGPEPLAAEDSKLPERLPLSFSRASRVSAKEVDYPAVREIHRAGKSIQARPEPYPAVHDHIGLPVKEWAPSPAPTGQNRPMMSLAEAVYQRRSKRNFIREPLDRNQISSIINALGEAGLDSGQGKNYLHTMTIGLLVNQADDLDPGFYLLDTKNHLTGLVKPDSYAPQMGRICLDQAWLSNAALHVLFITNLKLLEEVWGPRGYRYAMMTAGRLGQRIYLLATAIGLGCCGIGAFYDREAADLLEMNQDSRLLYLVALGSVKSG